MGKIDREVVTVDLDAESIKKDFPILSNSENNKSLVYLDSGASAQMPQLVIDRINHYHRSEERRVGKEGR